MLQGEVVFSSQTCLDRNPEAFKPKIGKGKEGESDRRHSKGCNCKRSGCLKNYCECYEVSLFNCHCPVWYFALHHDHLAVFTSRLSSFHREGKDHVLVHLQVHRLQELWGESREEDTDAPGGRSGSESSAADCSQDQALLADLRPAREDDTCYFKWRREVIIPVVIPVTVTLTEELISLATLETGSQILALLYAFSRNGKYQVWVIRSTVCRDVTVHHFWMNCSSI